MTKKSIILMSITLVALLTVGLTGLAAAPSAQSILDRVEDQTALTGSGTALIELTVINKRGQERTNRMRLYRKESDGGSKQLLEYLSPADVEGTKFLSIDEGDGATQMWLYLPALGRERRIAGGATRQSFMGTDFTFEEIGGGSYGDDYTAERLDDQALNGKATYVLDLTPKSADSTYSQVRMWVWQDEFIPVRIDFYDTRGDLVKRLENGDFKRGDNGKWQPHTIAMSNLKKGSKTIVSLLETEKEDVPDETFSLRYLRR